MIHRWLVCATSNPARLAVRRSRRGMAPLELLVVAGLIIVLLSLLIPALQATRRRANRATCENNIKQLGLALLQYEEAFGRLPGSYMLYAQTRVNQLTLHGWGAAVLPYLELSALSRGYDWRLGPSDDSPVGISNSGVISIQVATVRCPSASRISGPYQVDIPPNSFWPGSPQRAFQAAPADYCVASGVRGLLAAAAYHGAAGGDRHGAMRPWITIDGRTLSRPVGVGDLRDGSSYTALLGERVGGDALFAGRGRWRTTSKIYQQRAATNGGGWGDPLNGEHWLAGSPPSGMPEEPIGGECSINCTNLRGYGFYSFHPAGANFLSGDGAVHFLSKEVAPNVITAFLTADKQEIVEAPF